MIGKNLKKIKCLVCSMMLVVSLTACGSGADGGEDNSKTDNSTNKVYQIGICQLGQHEALDSATLGFKDALTEKLGDRVSFDYRNAENSEEKCTEITTKFVADKKDLIMANATPALKSAYSATTTIPIVATSITDYGTALNIMKWSGVTGTNVTGTSDLARIEEQEDMILELFPNPKQIGILYCVKETNSVYQAQMMEDELEKDGVTSHFYKVNSKKDIKAVADSAASECDVIYIPTDNTLAENVDTLKKIFLDEGVPMIAGEEGMCKAGIATLSIDYYSIGYTAGEMAYEILETGSNPGSMEIRYAEQYTKKYNKENCEALGIDIPEDYTAI